MTIVDYAKFEVHYNTFYITSIDKTFIDVQVQSMDGNKMALHTDGYYGEYEKEELHDISCRVIKVTIDKYFEDLGNGTKSK